MYNIIFTKQGGNTMLIDFIPENFIKVTKSVKDFKEAVREAGEILLSNGIIEEVYIEKMIEVAETQKYIVIAPHIAMPHARPEDGVIKNGMSMLYLKEGVDFGHSEHDPVKVVFALAGKDHDSHLGLLSHLCEGLDDDDFVKRLLNIQNKEQIIKLLSK